MQGQARQIGGYILSPQETLVMITAHENHHVYRYRMLALRFQPFDQGVSKLMEVLVDEGKQRLGMLRHLTQRLQLRGLLSTVTRESSCFDRQTHFFVINKKMACATLGQALRDEGKALRLYSQLCQANQSAEMHGMLNDFTEQRLIQCQILQECRQRLRM